MQVVGDLAHWPDQKVGSRGDRRSSSANDFQAELELNE